MKGRIIAIDYGAKKTGLATTDPLQIIATALDTVPTPSLFEFLENYLKQEKVVTIVIGDPSAFLPFDHPNMESIQQLNSWIAMKYPEIKVDYQDESYTSIQAKEIILQSGAKKKKRRDKNLVDKISAVLILQKYLGHI